MHIDTRPNPDLRRIAFLSLYLSVYQYTYPCKNTGTSIKIVNATGTKIGSYVTEPLPSSGSVSC